MNKYVERIYNGLWKENPTIVLMLGMCPTLAVTTSAINGVGMGVSTLFVLVLSNLIISLCRKIIPDEVRLPAYIVIAASLVTVVDLIMQAYTPSLYDALGIYIPLIVVNCIILGRAEAYAGKNEPLLSAADGLGMGLGFTVALIIIGSIRELIGAGTIFNHTVFVSRPFPPIAIFVKSPGAFLIIGFLIAIINALKIKNRSGELVNGCDEGCMGCSFAQFQNPQAAAAKSTAAVKNATAAVKAATEQARTDAKKKDGNVSASSGKGENK